MPPRKKKTPNVYETPFTPLFEDVPTGMSVVDRAVYGFIVRMETRDSKKSTASAATIGLAIGANEKTVDRTLARLMEWNVIKRIYKGKTKKEPSHYVSVPRSKWDENTINGAAQNKTEKRKLARVKLSSTRVNLSEDKGQIVQDKGQIDPQRENKRVSKERSKRVPSTKKSKKEENGLNSPTPAPIRLSPDATHPPVARAPLPPEFVHPDGTINAAELWKAFEKTGQPAKQYGAWVNSQLEGAA